MVDDSDPHGFHIHPVIAVPKPVADTADVMPGQAGTQTLRIFPEPYRSLADEQELALDRCNRLRVFPKCLQVHAMNKLYGHVDAVEAVSQG